LNDQADAKQQMKRLFGLFLFWFSWVLWTVPFALPFVVDSDVETIAVATAAVLVVAEVCFFTSLLLLGKPFYLAMKKRVNALWGTFKGKNRST